MEAVLDEWLPLAKLATIGVAALGVACAVLYPYNRWRYRKIPGPTGLPLIGNMPGIIRNDITRYLVKMEKKYGKIFKVWWGSAPWVVIADEKAARRVMSRIITRPDVSVFAMLVGEEALINRVGLLSLHGPRWRVARRAFESALMHRAALEMHTSVMNSCIDRLITRIGHLAAGSRGGEVDVAPLMGDLTLDVVGSCVFGVAFNTQGDGDGMDGNHGVELPYSGRELVAALKGIFNQAKIENSSKYVPLGFMFPTLRPVLRVLANLLPDAGQRRTLHMRKVINDTSRALMRAYRQQQDKAGAQAAGKGDAVASGDSGDGPHSAPDVSAEIKVVAGKKGADPGLGVHKSSFLALLADGRDNGSGVVLTEPEILAQIFTFLLAGYETTATTLTFALHLLAAHPEAQACAATEVAAALAPGGGGAAAMAAGADELARAFPYCSAIIDETLRTYPPAGNAIRTAFNEDLDVEGVIIPKGSWMHLPMYNFNLDPAIWPQADKFLPERWLRKSGAGSEGPGDSAPVHPELQPLSATAYMPFGAGARACPGVRFALQEARLALVKLVAAFQFDLPPGTPMELPVRTGITMSPTNPVMLRVTPRVVNV